MLMTLLNCCESNRHAHFRGKQDVAGGTKFANTTIWSAMILVKFQIPMIEVDNTKGGFVYRLSIAILLTFISD